MPISTYWFAISSLWKYYYLDRWFLECNNVYLINWSNLNFNRNSNRFSILYSDQTCCVTMTYNVSAVYDVLGAVRLAQLLLLTNHPLFINTPLNYNLQAKSTSQKMWQEYVVNSLLGVAGWGPEFRDWHASGNPSNIPLHLFPIFFYTH